MTSEQRFNGLLENQWWAHAEHRDLTTLIEHFHEPLAGNSFAVVCAFMLAHVEARHDASADEVAMLAARLNAHAQQLVKVEQ